MDSLTLRVVARHLRYAGQWAPPPALWQSIAKWVSSLYASHVLGLVERDLETLQAPVVAQAELARLQEEASNAATAFWTLKMGQKVRLHGEGTSYATVTRIETGFSLAYQQGTRTQTESVDATRSLMAARLKTWYEEQIGYAKNTLEEAQQPAKIRTRTKTISSRRITELALMRRECLKYTSKGNIRANKVEARFDVDLTGWRYLTDEEQARVPAILEEERFKEIDVLVLFRGQHDDWAGVWHLNKRQIELDIPGAALLKNTPTLDTFQTRLRSLLGTTWHEIQHVGQDLLRMIRKLPEDAGLPSRDIRDPNVYPGGIPRDAKPLRKKDQRVEHHLRDVELYTNLGNDTRDLEIALEKITVPDRRAFFAYFVGENQADTRFEKLAGHSIRMWKLRRDAPDKWRKVVSELAKVADRYL